MPTTDVKSPLYQVGAVSPIGLGFLMASYGHKDDDGTAAALHARTFSIGYDYFLSKATDIYAVAMNERADRAVVRQHGRRRRSAPLLRRRAGRFVPHAPSLAASSVAARPRRARRRRARRAR